MSRISESLYKMAEDLEPISYSPYKIDEEYKMVLTEKNLNRITKGHDDSGYVIISANRSSLYETPQGDVVGVDEGEKPKPDWRELSGVELVAGNNARTRELRDTLGKVYKDGKIREDSLGYSYIPVWGGYKEEGSASASTEAGFIVYPNKRDSNPVNFDKLVKDMFKQGRKYNQDTILIKYPDKFPQYYNCKTETPDGPEFKNLSLHDATKEFFTSLYGKRSPKFDYQRFTFEECYINQYPSNIGGLRTRTMKGELTTLK